MGPAAHALQITLAYAAHVTTATGVQLALVFGPPLALAALMQPVALQSERWTERLVGRRALWIAAGCVATALHELGHAALALLFGHRVTRVKWFDFAAEDGALGQVDHEFDPTSFYQRVGRFFIGIAPIVLAALVIAAATRWLLGVHAAPSLRVATPAATPASVAATARALAVPLVASLHAVGGVAAALRLDRWQSWAFVYLAYLAGSAMRLSASDLRGAVAGLWTMTWLLLLANAVTVWMGAFATSAAASVAGAMAAVDVALLTAIALQLLVGGAALAVTHGIAFFREREALLARG
ncbi:MAG TPA: hypothetical protein VFJ74_05000 [Gemmatimonadaceae bacterium]|nr:hypothetical protein [Gemmatimonadaceae bacterium]